MISDVTSKKSWWTCAESGYRPIFDISREIISSCDLKTPSSSSDTSTCFQSANFNKFFSKVALNIAGLIFDKSPLSHVVTNLSPICWEADLQEAAKLYRLPGVWDVDKECVSTLQTISVTIVKAMITQFWEHVMRRYRVDGFLSSMNHGLWRSTIADTALSFLQDRADILMQLHMYPSFTRFLQDAKHRSHGSNSSDVTVSCKGLRRSRRQVQAAALKLLRFVLVNYLKHSRTWLTSTALGMAVNHYLLCFIQYSL